MRAFLLSLAVLAIVTVSACNMRTIGMNPTPSIGQDPGAVREGQMWRPNSGVKVLNRAALDRWIYVADGALRLVIEYRKGVRDAAPVRSVLFDTAPRDVAVDGKGNVFVSLPDDSKVIEYDPGFTRITRTLSVSDATALAVDARGDVFVASPSKYEIYEFAPGATTAWRSVRPAGEFLLYGGIALDQHANLYVDLSPRAGALLERCPLSMAAKFTCRILGYPVGAFPGGVAIDGFGNLVVGGAGTLLWFAPPEFKQVRSHYFGTGAAIGLIASDADGTLYAPILGKTPSIAIVSADGSTASIVRGLKAPLGVAVTP